MIIANKKRRSGLVRTLVQSDKKDVMKLLERSRLTHVHSGWRPLDDWFGQPGFVGWENDGILSGFLAVGADPLPAFWVRGTAFKEKREMPALLADFLAATIPWMKQQGGTILAWMPLFPWPDKVLPDLGFERTNEVVMMQKDNVKMPEVGERETGVRSRTPLSINPDIFIRPVTLTDFPNLAKIEAAAFEPTWRFSANSLKLAMKQSIRFEVAEIAGRVVGYQCSTEGYNSAHLARMTIHPEWQGKGIGTALMVNAMQAYQKIGANSVTLNTQIDNWHSQQLYKKFGFYLTNNRVPVWVRNL